MKQIAIVVLHFGSKDNTIECLRSIAQLTGDNLKLTVIVVDNGSREKFEVRSFDFAQDKSEKSEVKIIRNEENLGYSGGMNVGIKYTLKNGAEYILILNNDTIVDKNLIRELLQAFEQDERVGICVPKVYFAKGYEFHKSRYKDNELGKIIWYVGGEMDWDNVIGYHKGVDEVDHGQYDKVESTNFASGNCMLIKREVFETAGFFDERYFLYYEDSDFSMRVNKAGYKIVYVPKAILWHKNAAAAGGSGSELQDYYITRNRLLFGMRYAPFRSKLALLRESFNLLTKGRKWQKKGVIDFYLRRFTRGSFPI